MDNMIKWEYLELNNPTVQELSDAGKNGWELVSSDGVKYTFKRIKY